jgi:hypothetical protein
MNSEELIKKRIYSVMPVSSMHMMEFLKVLEIRFTDDVPTAAITSRVRPKLLLNKAFIEKYCKTDEHLFMLIMHEIYHIILGHTRLFDNHTMLDNLAFDAVINAILCRLFPEEEYVSFFKNLNYDNVFPSCLLRPIGENTPVKFHKILNNLYDSYTGTYFEVYEIICNTLGDKLLKDNFILLGNHSDNYASRDPLLKDMIDSITNNWQIGISGVRRIGSSPIEKIIDFQSVKRDNQIKMQRLLNKAGMNLGVVPKMRISNELGKTEIEGFIPNFKDRTVLSKTILYGRPLLYNREIDLIKPVSDTELKTLVYLDVSGSVVNSINSLASLLLKPYKNGECLLFVFSTIVDEVTYKDFKEGRYRTTGGTDINCIFDHYFSLPKAKQTKKILILTDGYTGRVNNRFYNEIKRKKLEIYCGLFGEYYTRDDLQPIIKYFEEFKYL